MTEATLSSKNQIVIPRAARAALQVKAGDKLLVVVRGRRVIVLEKPRRPSEALRGLGRGLYPPGHIAKERRGWERQRG